MTNTQVVGTAAENLACRYLQQAGLVLVTKNFRAKCGEIDLIMEQAELLIFIEVRLRNNSKYGSGLDSINWQKQQKIVNTAQLYLQKFPKQAQRPCRFDVVSIKQVSSENPSIEWIKSAFTA